MKIPEACFNSKIGEATRRCRYSQMKYVARLYRHDDGTFDIKYKRYNEFGNEYEAYRHEVEGYDDWVAK